MPEVDRTPDWQPRSEEALNNQLATYDQMRESCPVAWSEYQHWTVFRHADVMAVLNDHDTFSNAVSSHLSVPNGMDPPIHTPYRKVIEPYFSDHAMARFEPTCRSIARELVKKLPTNEPFDAVDALSQPFALQIQCAFMGWPESLQAPLNQWVKANHRATLSGDREAMAFIAEQFDGYIRQLLEVRRNAGAEAAKDNTSLLMEETVNGRRMTDEELISLLRNWTVGELGTISACVSILLNYLASHPELHRQLARNPLELPEAIDEILRMDAPLMSNRRVTTRPVELGGHTIPAGEKITILWASANRDERVFGDPDAFCPARNHQNNLLYGAGVHVCPGAPLARMELRILMEEWLAAVTRVTGADHSKPERALFPAGGFHHLPLVIEKR